MTSQAPESGDVEAPGGAAPPGRLDQRLDQSRVAPACPRLLGWGLAAACVTFLWWYKVGLVRRPFWLGTTDHEHTYIFNSLVLALGEPPVSWAHPGTPVVGLGVLLVRWLRAGVGDVERILSYAHPLALAFTLEAMAMVARSFMSRGAPALVTTGILLTFFMHPAAPMFLGYWGAYSVILPVAVLSLWSLWRSLRVTESGSNAHVVLSGAFAGFACSVLLLFIPVVLGGLVGHAVYVLSSTSRRTALEAHRPPRIKRFLLGWIAIGAGLALFGLIFGAHLISAGEMARVRFKVAVAMTLFGTVMLALIRWLLPPHTRPLQLMMRTAAYVFGVLLGWGVGTLGFPQATQFAIVHFWYSLSGTNFHGPATFPLDVILTNSTVLLTYSPLWSALVLVVLFLLGRLACTPRQRRGLTRVHPALQAFALALLTAIIVGTVTGLKEGTFMTDTVRVGASLRYLLPVAAVVAVALAWLSGIEQRRWSARWGALLLAAFLVVGMQDLKSHRILIASGEAQNAWLDARLGELAHRLGRQPRVLMGPGISRPSTSFRSANSNYAGGRFLPQIDAIFPYEGLLDVVRNGPLMSTDPRLRGYDLLLVPEKLMTPSLSSMLQGLGEMEQWTGGLEEPLVAVYLPPERWLSSTGHRPRDAR